MRTRAARIDGDTPATTASAESAVARRVRMARATAPAAVVVRSAADPTGGAPSAADLNVTISSLDVMEGRRDGRIWCGIPTRLRARNASSAGGRRKTRFAAGAPRSSRLACGADSAALLTVTVPVRTPLRGIHPVGLASPPQRASVSTSRVTRAVSTAGLKRVIPRHPRSCLFGGGSGNIVQGSYARFSISPFRRGTGNCRSGCRPELWRVADVLDELWRTCHAPDHYRRRADRGGGPAVAGATHGTGAGCRRPRPPGAYGYLDRARRGHALRARHSDRYRQYRTRVGVLATGARSRRSRGAGAMLWAGCGFQRTGPTAAVTARAALHWRGPAGYGPSAPHIPARHPGSESGPDIRYRGTGRIASDQSRQQLLAAQHANGFAGSGEHHVDAGYRRGPCVDRRPGTWPAPGGRHRIRASRAAGSGLNHAAGVPRSRCYRRHREGERERV